MFLRYSVKRSVLALTPIYFHTRLIHFSSRILIGSVISYDGSEKDNEHYETDTQNPNSNFLGIENDSGVITIKPYTGSPINNMNLFIDKRFKSKSKEKFYRTSFGIIRNDTDNKLRHHGQYEKFVNCSFPHKSTEFCDVTEVCPKTIPNCTIESNAANEDCDIKVNSFEQRMDNRNLDSKSKCDIKENQIQSCVQNLSEVKVESYIDKQFFESIKENDDSNEAMNKFDDKGSNFLDENYFGNSGLAERQNNRINSENDFSAEKKPVQELNFVDESYFGNPDFTDKQIHEISFEQKVFSFENTKAIDVNAVDKICTQIPSFVERQNHINSKEKDFPARKNNRAIEKINSVDENNFRSNDYTRDTTDAYNLENLSSEVNSICKTVHYKNENFSLINSEVRKNGNLNQNYKYFNSDLNEKFMTSIENKHITKELFSDRPNIKINANQTVSKDYKSNNMKTSGFNYANLMSNFNKVAERKLTSKDQNALISKNKILLQQEKTILNDESSIQSSNIVLKFDNGPAANNSAHLKIHNLHPTDTTDLKNETYKEGTNTDSTAYDFVTKLRNKSDFVNKGFDSLQKEKLDSKGFRILQNQVPDLSLFTRDEIINLLKNNVLYSDDDLMIVNKPYSLIMHDSQTTVSPCLSTFLDDFAQEMDQKASSPKLFTVHRLDKETTGCLLLARNEDMAQHLKYLFAQRKIVKKYWVITIKVPEQLEGIIDIPITEGSINGKKRMVLNPNIPKDIPYENHVKSGKKAVTAYKVMSVSGNAALVEVTPETGLKHQIRVHFGFGLSCPILGDHKYSYLDKLVPQKLPSDMLQRLHVRQSKVRYVPMHIHARSITVPSHLDGRDLFVMAPLPEHMKINLRRLKFRKK